MVLEVDNKEDEEAQTPQTSIWQAPLLHDFWPLVISPNNTEMSNQNGRINRLRMVQWYMAQIKVAVVIAVLVKNSNAIWSSP